MDLASRITSFKQSEMAGKVQFAVARKILDNQQLQGAAAVKLIESAARTSAQAGDALVAAATGLGGKLDTFA